MTKENLNPSTLCHDRGAEQDDDDDEKFAVKNVGDGEADASPEAIAVL
jgi:hypothetical protein